MTKQETVAREILQTLPLVMRPIGAELRQTQDIPSPAHFGILFMLQHGAHNLSDLAKLHNVSLPTMSNSISILEQRGLVRRTRAQHDRRQVVIEVSDSGRDILARVTAMAEARLAGFLQTLSAAELDQLSAGMSVLRTAFHRPISEPIPPGA